MRSNLHEDFNKTRFQFLNTDLDLAMTFMQIAETERSLHDSEHAARAFAKARVALQSVRFFWAKPGLSAEQVELLADRCRVLEAAIEQFSSGA